jgi:hypothetical protein
VALDFLTVEYQMDVSDPIRKLLVALHVNIKNAKCWLLLVHTRGAKKNISTAGVWTFLICELRAHFSSPSFSKLLLLSFRNPSHNGTARWPQPAVLTW